MASIYMLTAVLLVGLATGCATDTQHFKPESIGSDKGVVIGNIKIAYNRARSTARHAWSASTR